MRLSDDSIIRYKETQNGNKIEMIIHLTLLKGPNMLNLEQPSLREGRYAPWTAPR
ncbi:hypothetical protein DBT_0637 [Dissulfuribacter thermophilus]|uniref:Uncharacterized protein n=1 Tax=Dissulfuribacter thermophilus TaxID=1156395 RepID=A0A1B9F8N5_9BACT|nr:hypothetical protein [Dissulfuribacter thermophilus]OCC16175.1 hypothetical protein DBT_0637 [Dissulfuribacter thermophilus]